MRMKQCIASLNTLVREIEAWQHRYPKELKNYPVTIDCAKKMLIGLREELEFRGQERK